MYQVGERIIYGGSGVCEVRAVGPLESVGGDRLYYTLVPLYGSGVIYAPVDGPVFNRPLLTPQELHGLLEQFSEIPAEPWWSTASPPSRTTMCPCLKATTVRLW